MKRIVSAVLAVGLLAAAPLAGRARAEDAAADGGAEAHHKKDGDHAAHMEKMMKERFGLSDDQAAKLKAAWEEEKAAVKPLREQAKEARRKLEEQVRGLASDKEIQATLDQLDANRKAMEAEHQKVQSAMATVLRPSQRAKMRLMMAHRPKGGREGAEHGPKGRKGACAAHGREEHRGAWDHRSGDEHEDHDDD